MINSIEIYYNFKKLHLKLMIIRHVNRHIIIYYNKYYKKE